MTSGAVHVLIVDDEADIRQTLSEYFTHNGLTAHCAANRAEMFAVLAAEPVSIVVLDLRLGDEDGLALCRELQDRPELGVIMLTGAADTIDRVVGLEVGADDYIAKPFELREVLARVKSLARRLHRTPDPAYVAQTLPVGAFSLNVEAQVLSDSAGGIVALSTAEFDLLRVFAERPGRVLSREQLLDLAGVGYTDPFDRAVDVRITRLRRKIEENPSKPTLIRTVRGVGYVFSPNG